MAISNERAGRELSIDIAIDKSISKKKIGY